MNPGARLLRKWREEKGFSQTDAALELDVSQAAYCDWETGKKTPRLKGLLKIEEKVGISPGDFKPDQIEQPRRKNGKQRAAQVRRLPSRSQPEPPASSRTAPITVKKQPRPRRVATPKPAPKKATKAA